MVNYVTGCMHCSLYLYCIQITLPGAQAANIADYLSGEKWDWFRLLLSFVLHCFLYITLKKRKEKL